jgi:hypothetical protein
MSHSDIAYNLAHFELLGDVDLINHEIEHYRLLKVEDLKRFANEFLIEENASVLYYSSKNKQQ